VSSSPHTRSNNNNEGTHMPRCLIQRTFPTGLAIPMNDDGAAIDKVNTINASEGVTWSHSYVSGDKQRTFCIYDGPSPARSGASPN